MGISACRSVWVGIPIVSNILKPRAGFLSEDEAKAFEWLCQKEGSRLNVHFGCATGEEVSKANVVQNDPVVVLHDTTAFIYKREDIDSVGQLNKGAAAKNHLGRTNYYTSCGILMHSNLAVTTEGLPLGLAAINSGYDKSSKDQCAQEENRPNPGTDRTEKSIRWL